MLNANNFFSNRAGVNRPPYKQNQFGGSIGGPIRKDKTFFFANEEDYWLRQLSPSITTVPTPLQRAGDFSQTYNSAGNQVIVADPLTSRQLVDGSWTRTPFPGNVIPVSRFSTVASNVEKVYPLPNVATNSLSNVSNYSTVGGGGTTEHQIVGKVDENYSARWKFFATFNRTWAHQFSVDPLGYSINLTRPNLYDRTHVTVAATAVFSPALIGEFHSGFARYNNPSIPYDLGIAEQE